MKAPSMIVCGSQAVEISQEHLAALRNSLVSNNRLQYLVQAIRDLPNLWGPLTMADPALQCIPGHTLWSRFANWIDFKDSLLCEINTESKMNALITPLLVISQIVDYTEYLEALSPPQTHSETLDTVQQGGIQGFCAGFLTAIVLSCAKNDQHIAELGAVAFRLAACAGVYVDFDNNSNQHVSIAARWAAGTDEQDVLGVLHNYPTSYIAVRSDQTAATITLQASDLSAISRSLAGLGIKSKLIPLSGRFHHPVHQDSVRKLERLCASMDSLRFPDSVRPLVPLRRNVDGKRLQTEPLHTTALSTLMLDMSDWHRTVSYAVNDMKGTGQILTIGLGDCVPKSIKDRQGIQACNSKRASTNNTYEYPEGAIAIISMACRYPGADSLEEYWNIIASGISMVGEMPPGRFQTTRLRRDPEGKIKFKGNFLRNADMFDHRFFKRSSREAAAMDPQHRIALEVAYETLESAGYFNEKRPKQDIGVYMGVAASDYEDNVASHLPTAFSVLGMVRAFTSGKISHFFGFSGPSMVFDTACSSSMVAIHTACRALQADECSMALAGGVNVITSPNLHHNLGAANFLTPTGASKSFDDSADGYCRGEGAGLVLLKKLSSALVDKDRILGVIVGSAVNQNDNSYPITVPASSSQTALYRRVLQLAQMPTRTVSYVEAHGTGTPKGDPIECASIREVFGGHGDRELLFGSVKGNIGHTEAASGVAGLIKVLLMIEAQKVPPQASFVTLNRNIPPLGADNMAIANKLREWNAGFRAACVNNYGAAGSNAALIVAQPPSRASDAIEQSASACQYPVILSANTLDSVRKYAQALQKYLKQTRLSGDHFLASIAFHLSRRRNPSFRHAAIFSVSSVSELHAKLEQCATAEVTILPSKPVVLAFGGQTGDIIHLSEQAYRRSYLLQKYLNECDILIREMGLHSLFPGIFQRVPVRDTVDLHCMLFALQYASACAWMESGLTVKTVIGHSFGQLTAMCVAGVMSLPDALRLVSGRATIINDSWGEEKGSMMLIHGEHGRVEDLLSQVNHNWTSPSSAVRIACYNGPTSFVVVGSEAQIRALESVSTSMRLRARTMNITHGFHSRFVDSIMPDYCELTKGLSYNPPAIPVETCSKGESWPIFTAELVAQQSREPVYFAEAVNRIANRLGPCTWVEAGSASGIATMVQKALHDTDQHDFHSMSLATSELSSLAESTTNLWKAGIDVDYWLFNKQQQFEYLDLHLPPYQFERSRHWLDYIDRPGCDHSITEQPAQFRTKPRMVTLIKKTENTAEFRIDQECEQYQALVRGHAVLGSPLCPAALYVEIVASAARALVPDFAPSDRAACIEELQMLASLAIDLRRSLSLTLSLTSCYSWKFNLYGRSSRGDIRHASGQITITTLTSHRITTRFSRYRRIIDYNRCEALLSDSSANTMQGPILYRLFDKVVIYADIFRGVQKISCKNQEATGLVAMPEIGAHLVKDNVCNPLLVDSFTQVAGVHVNSLDECGPEDVFLCTAIENIEFSRTLGSCSGSWLVYSSFERAGPRELISDIFVFDSASKGLIMTIFGVRFSKVSLPSLRRTLERANAQREPQSRSVPVSKALPTEHVTQAKIPKQRATSQQTNEVKEAVASLLHEVADVPFEDISDNSLLEDIGIDSLMTTELLSAIRERFNSDITTSAFQQVVTVKDLYRILSTAPGSGSGALTPLSMSESDGSLLDKASTSTPRSEASFALVEMPHVDEGAAKLSRIIAEHLDTSDRFHPDTLLRDLGLDSLVGIELAADIWKMFGKKIDLAALEPDTTFEELCRMVSPTPVVEINKADKNARVQPKSTADCSPTGQNGLSNSAEVFARMRNDYAPFAEQTGFLNFRRKVFHQQSELVCAYVTEAFAKLGCDLRNIAPGAVLPSVSYIPRHAKVMRQYYHVLEDAGLVIINDNGDFIRTGNPVSPAKTEDLYQEISKNFPQHLCEHRLLHSTGSRLAACLTGDADPLQILFGTKAGKDAMEDVYTNSPMFATGTRILGEFFIQAFKEYRGREELHILELGAGTGGTAKYIVEILLEHNIPFKYTFTDLSPSLVALAKRKFSPYGDCMEFAVLDVEKNPPEHMQRSYHAVLASNCVHATKDLVRSSVNAHKLLRDGGVFCLLELTRNLYWLDCVFGLLEGWWVFEDGRQHVLADEYLWERTLRQAGFRHIDWSDDDTEESDQFRLITGFMSDIKSAKPATAEGLVMTETVPFATIGDIPLLADIYYPLHKVLAESSQPIALMVHGGGHIMLSRKDIRPSQTKLLLDYGFLPVSIDYRLCPEVNLTDGPIADVCTALDWARSTLPALELQRPDIHPDGGKVVVIGWSTGGTLAMSLPFSAPQLGIRPPDAILAFYCPTDYEDKFWRQPNYPEGTSPDLITKTYDILEGVQDHPITAYNIPAQKRVDGPAGGWMSLSDARSRIALHMNWRGQALPVLLNGLPSKNKLSSENMEYDAQDWLSLPQPDLERVRAVSPYAQIKSGNYSVPTFLIHGAKDDLVPWKQAQKAADALAAQGVPNGIEIIESAVHLFDLFRDPEGKYKGAIMRGLQFLVEHVQ
ncbi:non-reducing polyketide synthase spyA [Aspergillus mulundensis]|uniref:Uncharacterized protein n=1 Tax=Aspergillus mulundensis TaxID=1810919 RepID=A0A3D8T3Q2_9EURO|nr:Uncharacterized protein DSM5745_00509 [Aspergillus mulundensis]RDW93187.1 Uncharacterized protein DSM5745_00509 [Aspergillus mulundensis]